ncbi:MAG: sugar phosphate isomerase/epimerase [Planctomycetes bacterium]|nr:sugar phosphate isomerase/epimerase [Planctomycetota bacterium]
MISNTGSAAGGVLSDTARLCLHTITTRPWSLAECVRHYAAAGVRGISVWRNCLETTTPSEARRMIADAGLTCVSLVRGGFFTGATAAERQKAIDENRRVLDEAAGVGAPLVVLVCGATPRQSARTNIEQIREGIEAVIGHAAARGVKLSIEPLHPMYADVRSAIVTLRDANDLCEAIGSPHVGVTVDVFHLWWDPALQAEIARCGRAGNLLSFHVCDWKTGMADMLNDRGLMGEGVIDVPAIRGWVEAAGFGGFIEVEIFSNRWWQEDQHRFLDAVVQAYLQHT